MRARTVALAGVAMAAIVALSILGTWQWASARGPDVDNDGWVTGQDIFEVIRSFNEYVAPKTPPQRRETKGVIRSGMWESVESFCEEGETVLGGGYSLGSIGFSDKVNADGPITVGGLDGWIVSVYNSTGFDIDLWVTAICASP